MSIIKVANDLENISERVDTTTADYVVPSILTGAVGGAGLGGLANSGYLKNKKVNPKKALTGAVGGSVVGSFGGIGASPVVSRLGNLTKYTGDKITGETDKISDQGKSALTSALVGGAAGSVVGNQLKKTKGLKGKPALAGGLIGGAGLGSVNYGFEKSVQKGKERRNENKKKREEYKALKKELKELS